MPDFENRTTRCPCCDKNFIYKYRVPANPDTGLIILLTCPFCNSRLQVDLAPYLRRRIVSYKGAGTDEGGFLPPTLELPEEIPAIKRNSDHDQS